MEHAIEYHSALITISSVFIGVSGIIMAIVLSSNSSIFRGITGWFVIMSSISIAAGIVSMIFNVSWFINQSVFGDWAAGIALIIQFIALICPLATLVQAYLSRKE